MTDHYKTSANRTVGKNIRAIRQKYRWSQEDAANKLDISIPAFSKIETGITDVNVSRLEQIADIFGLTVAEVFTFSDEEKEVDTSALQETQAKLQMAEKEILSLQRKVIGLYEELRQATSLSA